MSVGTCVPVVTFLPMEYLEVTMIVVPSDVLFVTLKSKETNAFSTAERDGHS
jgi:hypothetical protein